MSAILLKQTRSAKEKYGNDPVLQTVVPRGELVLELPFKERITRTDGHNYCLYSNNAITLYDDGTGASPLHGAELDYLVAIADPQKRISQYLEPGKLKWIMDLRYGDTVTFRLPQGSNAVLMPVRGRVRYYGRFPGHEGVLFGLEIIDRDCKGKGNSDGSPYFQCGHNNAVYVSMDKISSLSKIVNKPIKDQPKPSGPAVSTRSKTEGKSLLPLLDKAEENFGMGAPPVTTTSHPLAARFSIDDRVVIQTAQGVAVRGLVRWVGPVKMSRSAGGIYVSTVGIETARPIDDEAEFPGLTFGVTSSHGRQLFPVPPNHGRIFLAEQLVLLEEEYRQQKREERSTEAVVVKKQGVTNEFTIGTLVGVQMERGPPMYGIIQWIGAIPGFEGGKYAGVELDKPFSGCSDGTYRGRRFFTCPPGTGFFCLLSALSVDQRYMEPNQVPAAKMINPIQAPQYDDSDIPGGPELFTKYIGDEHGIQGHYNSCYLDATVFGLFALSDSFDMMHLEEPESEIGEKIKHILWKGIVNPLRKFGVARFESIMELRNELENLGRMKGANRDEKDPEEFLNLLFKETLHMDPFISIKRPFGVEKEFFVQLFLEIEQDQTAPPNSEYMIRKMFHEQNMSFTTVPSKLLLQMPRFGKDFKMFSKIIPALEMDVKPLLDPDSRLGYVTMFSKMQLLSVICIETSHYVCFTRDKDRWLFHDSMANRLYDTYNIPRVTDVSQELNHWVYTPENQKILLQASPRDIPECVRRFTQDTYMCVYINPDLDRYAGALEINDQSIGIGYQNNRDKMLFDQQELNKTKEECKILQKSQKELEKDLQHRISEHEITKRNMRTLQDTHSRQLQAEKEANKAALIEKERIIAEKEGVIAEKERIISEKEEVIAEMKQTAENFAQSWKINHKDVTLTATELGRGGWGYIRVGVFREQRVAVKQLYNIIVSEVNLAVMNREINTMSRLRHPNLLLFIGAVLDHPSGNPLIITEIMDTSLRSAYEKGQITGESVKLSILRDTASALNYLHCHPAGAIIHRDVSSANVLLETRGINQWRAKLSDFGSANEARKAVTKLQGAEVYAAPESFVSLLDDKEELQTTKMDVYSYGIMVCELMTCQFPSSSTVFRSMLQTVSPPIGQLVQDCINRSPEKRPTIQQVIRSFEELITNPKD